MCAYSLVISASRVICWSTPLMLRVPSTSYWLSPVFVMLSELNVAVGLSIALKNFSPRRCPVRVSLSVFILKSSTVTLTCAFSRSCGSVSSRVISTL